MMNKKNLHPSGSSDSIAGDIELGKQRTVLSAPRCMSISSAGGTSWGSFSIWSMRWWGEAPGLPAEGKLPAGTLLRRNVDCLQVSHRVCCKVTCGQYKYHRDNLALSDANLDKSLWDCHCHYPPVGSGGSCLPENLQWDPGQPCYQVRWCLKKN